MSLRFNPITGRLQDNSIRVGTTITGGTDKKVLFDNAGLVGEANAFIESTNVFALRNSTSAQSQLTYRTYTDGSNYERLFIGADHTGTGITGFAVFAENTGTGSARSLYIGTTGSGSLAFVTNNSSRWTINSSGHFLTNSDNAYDIGALNATRPRHIFAGSNVYATAFVMARGSTSYASIQDDGDGNIRLFNGAGSSFGLLKLGGTTSSFPALKRSSTTVQARLADDSAFTNVQGKLTTDTNYAAGVPTATGYLTVYDATGTAYKIPAVAA